MRQIGPSTIRTIVPMIVGLLLAALAPRGLAVPESVATEVVTVVVTGVYYGLARVAEVRLSPLWGWLLGLPKAPTYANVTEYDPRHDKN